MRGLYHVGGVTQGKACPSRGVNWLVILKNALEGLKTEGNCVILDTIEYLRLEQHPRPDDTLTSVSLPGQEAGFFPLSEEVSPE